MKIALVGNPNSGKSSLFNALTGLRQKVGNYPGVTVDRKLGQFQLPNGTLVHLSDLPGTYNIYPKSEDEAVSAKVLMLPSHPERPDLVLLVADATNLRRSVLLCTQVMDMGLPVVLALNMVDLIGKQGLEKKVKVLMTQLGIPVVPVSARKGLGLDDLLQRLQEVPSPRPNPFFVVPSSFDAELAPFLDRLQTQNRYLAWQASLRPDLLDLDLAANQNSDKLVSNELAVRYERIQELLGEECLAAPSDSEKTTDNIDRWLMHPFWGYLGFAAVLVMIFQAIFAWSSLPMDWIDAGFSAAGSWLSAVLPDHFLTRLLVEGIWGGLGGIVVFVPQIAMLFLFISILEDSGYMSRVVFLMDRIMRPFGFSGKSVIPLIGGMACAVPSIMMARTIPDKNERLITILATPFMSCSARIPVYVLLISVFVPEGSQWGIFNLQGLVMAAMYLLGFAMALLVAFVIKTFRKPSIAAHFVAELPLYRLPRWNNVGITIYHKCRTFVVEAGKVILAISVVLWLLQQAGPESDMEAVAKRFEPQLAAVQQDSVLKAQVEAEYAGAQLQASYAGVIGRSIEPLIRPLGFDWKIGISLLSSFAAREVFVGTMATLYSAGDGAADDESGRFAKLREKMAAERNPTTGEPVYTLAVAMALLVFYAFAMQCLSTVAVVQRETKSWKTALGMLAYMTAIAYLSALATYHLFS
jgi:ferrous iron transport protein B